MALSQEKISGSASAESVCAQQGEGEKKLKDLKREGTERFKKKTTKFI
jgi:hypothetical protein